MEEQFLMVPQCFPSLADQSSKFNELAIYSKLGTASPLK